MLVFGGCNLKSFQNCNSIISFSVGFFLKLRLSRRQFVKMTDSFHPKKDGQFVVGYQT